MLKKVLMAAIALLALDAAQARELFETNATTPYPPGCVSNNRDGLTTPTGGRQTYADDILVFSDASDNSLSANVGVQVFRRGCKDPDRSVMYMRFEMVTANRTFALPDVTAEIGGESYPLRLVLEPNTFESDETRRVLGPGTYEYLLDGMAEARVNQNSNLISPSQYTGPLVLRFIDPNNGDNNYSVSIPRWNTDITPFRIPITGRHSGPWVVNGAEDQGFNISFNEFLVGGDVKQFIFFSWYTFDGEGNTLWLTAGKDYDRGASAVEMEIQLVTGGTFLGDTPATREVVGSATLTAVDCSEMTLDYDLEDLGLGSGSVTLTRIAALEIAGYACNDLEARLDSL